MRDAFITMKEEKKNSEYHRALQTLSYGMWTRTVDLHLNMICHERFKADFRTYSSGKCHNKRYHVGRIKTKQHEIGVFEVSSLIYFLLCFFSRDPNFRFFSKSLYITENDKHIEHISIKKQAFCYVFKNHVQIQLKTKISPKK